VQFYTGVSYRNILVLKQPRFSPLVTTEKPDDNQGELQSAHMPAADSPEADNTVEFLNRLINEAPSVLGECPSNRRKAAANNPPANGIWPWSPGMAGSFKSLHRKFGITGAVISAVDVIAGLGRAIGMDVIRVPGATGYIDTNYEGKADAAIKALETHDLVYLHVEAIDEVSHERNLKKKITAIEDFDSRIVKRVIDAMSPELTAVVLPDHPVPVAIGKHTRTPVPVAVRKKGIPPDSVTSFDEIVCPAGSLGHMQDGDLMTLLFS